MKPRYAQAHFTTERKSTDPSVQQLPDGFAPGRDECCGVSPVRRAMRSPRLRRRRPLRRELLRGSTLASDASATAAACEREGWMPFQVRRRKQTPAEKDRRRIVVRSPAEMWRVDMFYSDTGLPLGL